jgi:hypothetical protein
MKMNFLFTGTETMDVMLLSLILNWIIDGLFHTTYNSKKYDAYINVEWCNKSIFIKYLFKYVIKGLDCSKMYFQRIRNGLDTPYDEDRYNQ